MNAYFPCLRNAPRLNDVLVRELHKADRRLTRAIKILNRKMRQYCVRDGHFVTDYPECLGWNEEKMKYYFQVSFSSPIHTHKRLSLQKMRIRYCDDVNQWPAILRK